MIASSLFRQRTMYLSIFAYSVEFLVPPRPAGAHACVYRAVWYVTIRVYVSNSDISCS